jgi:hypothetical protein
MNLQLTKSINITEGLTDEDNTTYTGLWLPTFNYDVKQIFCNLNSSQRKQKTILSVGISETAFFIRNNQKPIARRSEIIFHTILFIGVCIDLTCMMLLILKLWFHPVLIYFIDKLFGSNNFIYRLIFTRNNSSEIQMKKMEDQIEIMSKRMDTLMELIHHSYESNEKEINATRKEKF